MARTEIDMKFFESDDEDSENIQVSIKNAESLVLDLSASEETRIKALELYCTNPEPAGTDIINKLCSMYEIAGVRSMKGYLYAICEKANIDIFLKTLAAKTLCSVNDKDELGYKALSMIYPNLGPDIPTPYKIEMVKTLMKHDSFQEEAMKYFESIIQDMTLSSEYRYRTVLSGVKPYFVLKASQVFLRNIGNATRFRILAGQNILVKDWNQEAEDILFSIAEDEKQEYNARADATDVILQAGSESGKVRARAIIMKLGKTKGNSIYSNAQNVHTTEIEKSVEKALEFLQTFEIMKAKGKPIDVEYIHGKIRAFVEKYNKVPEIIPIQYDDERITVALNRIQMDRALYSKFSCTLEKILLKIWTYIDTHKSKIEMRKRLIQELSDMCDTCSSGFASRLVNTISGFGDFEMRISWRDQIIANVSGRLNARARNMDNLHIRDRVLEQMTLENSDYHARRHFLRFLRSSMSELREELYGEFKEHISDTDFDLYFRNAIQFYESGSYI